MRFLDRLRGRLPNWGSTSDWEPLVEARDPSGVRRWPAVATVVALVVGGLASDRLLADDNDDVQTDVGAEMPSAAPEAARSSAWFCAGATAEPGSLADGTVLIANAGRRPLRAVVTIYPTLGEPRQAALDVAVDGRASLRLGDLVVAPFASALVELDGGQAAVELEVTGPHGQSSTPCASESASSWYFAEGITTRDATEQLLVFNPFPDDAVVDFSFTTEEGRSRPLALTGVAVAGRSMSAVNVGDFVPRREGVTAQVVARRGRIAVNRLQVFDGSGNRRGMALTLGVAGTSPTWYFATGQVSDGVAERFHLYNPNEVEAEVEVGVDLDEGEVEPLLLTVPPEARLSVIAAEESRIPKGSPHSVTINSVNDVGLVVERTLDNSRPASPFAGLSISPGSLVAGPRWLVVSGGADDNLDEVLSISNPGPTSARVTVTALVDGARRDLDGLGQVEVAAHGRRSVRIADHLKAAAISLIVEADGDVVVERSLSRVNDLGTTTAPAFPLR